jgi:dephospho-CoA kinase
MNDVNQTHRRSGLSKPVIGMAGGIGSGKSLVSSQFASLGAAVIDADKLAREALDLPHVQEELRRWWGDGVIIGEGRIDRRAVGRIVFHDPAQLDRLEALIHPIVAEGRDRLREQFDADPEIPAIVEDCPLLFEVGIDKECDHTVFVASNEADRLRRVAARGWSADELARREKTQWSLDKKAQLADYVVENIAGPAQVFEQVRAVFSQIIDEA